MGVLYDLIFGVFVLTAVFATFGHYLDKKLHTTPLFSVTLGILAIIIGLTRLVIKAKELDKDGNSKK